MSLRRTHFRELRLNGSSADAVRSKVRSAEIVHKKDDCRPSHSASKTQHQHSFPSHHGPHPQRHSCPARVRHSIPRPNRRRHPIHTLPSELLSYIFVLGSSLPDVDHTFPIVVSHVCGGWRDVALNTPALWRRVCFHGNGGYNFQMWKERISRAKACSLDVEIGMPPPLSAKGVKGYFDIHTVQYYMHFVQPTLHRWRSLNIRFHEHAPFLWNASLSPLCVPHNGNYRGAYPPRIHAPLLEELSLIYPFNDDTKQFTLFGGNAPRLQSLTLDGIRLTWLPGLMANLRFLDYTHRGEALSIRGNQAVSLVLDMLQVSSRLEELRLCFPAPIRGGNGRDTLPGHARAQKRLALPFLTTLHLRVDGPDIPQEMYNLLPNLSLPSLATLCLVDLGRSTHSFPHLNAFLRVFRIPLNIRYLRLERGWVDHRVLPTLFHYLQALKRATVIGARIPDPYFVGFEVKQKTRGNYSIERIRHGAGPRLQARQY